MVEGSQVEFVEKIKDAAIEIGKYGDVITEQAQNLAGVGERGATAATGTAILQAGEQVKANLKDLFKNVQNLFLVLGADEISASRYRPLSDFQEDEVDDEDETPTVTYEERVERLLEEDEEEPDRVARDEEEET